MIQTTYKVPSLKMKKVSVGRMLIAVYVLAVLALSATAKAQETKPCLKIQNQISN